MRATNNWTDAVIASFHDVTPTVREFTPEPGGPVLTHAPRALWSLLQPAPYAICPNSVRQPAQLNDGLGRLFKSAITNSL